MPEPDGFWLTPRDKELLKHFKRLLAENTGEWWGDISRGVNMSPEIYFAALPEGHSIKGFDSSTGVKSGICNLYKIFTVEDIQEGTLTTRTNDSDGTLTMSSGSHGVVEDTSFDLHWDGGRRRHVKAGEVNITEIPITGGVGSPLPTISTTISVTVEIHSIQQTEEAQQRIFNVSKSDVPEGTDPPSYFLVVRDKFGRWIRVGEPPPNNLIAKNESGSPIAAGASGTVIIYDGDPLAEESTEEELVIYNKTSVAWANDTFGGVTYINGHPYGFPWECPPS